MKNIIVYFVLFTACFSFIYGEEIYGTIRLKGKPIGAGAKVQISVNNKMSGTETDNKGFYSIHITDRGKGELRVFYDRQAPSHPIYSSSTAVRYDFALIKQNGKYYLRRE